MYLWGGWLNLLQYRIDSGKDRWVCRCSDNFGRHPLFFWVTAHVDFGELGVKKRVDLEWLRPMKTVGAKHLDGLKNDAIRQANPKALKSIVMIEVVSVFTF